MDMDILTTTIALPLWSVIATALAGVIIGVLLMMLAIMLVSRYSAKKVATTKTVDKPVSPVVEPPVDVALPADLVVLPTAPPRPVERYKPVPPARQHYWYYVSGVAGRFATLRDALSALSVDWPADKLPEWSKLPQTICAKIKRVKVGDEDPLAPVPVVVPPVVPPVIPSVDVVVKSRPVGVKDDDAGIIKKPIGNGCFVTIRKKKLR